MRKGYLGQCSSARRFRVSIYLLGLFSLTFVQYALAADRMTLESLLHEMIDMERLAVAPPVGLESDQQSSYDRASTSPHQPNWFANGDAGQFIRQEENHGRKEFVMAEMTGPGAIVRIWSANPDGGGTIRIYIDNLDTPAIEEDFLALTSATLPEFPAPFSGRRSLGANLYLPIPYQERCKVTVSQPSLYYHVGYRTFPEGTQVEPFSMGFLARAKKVIDEVGGVLSIPGSRFVATAGAARSATEITLGPREAEQFRFEGPAAIVRTEVRPVVSKDQLPAALRESVVMIRWDGQAEPAVWCPLGDFFASTPGINSYSSLPAGMSADGVLYSNWFMPFRKQAEIVIRNDSDDPITLRLAAWTRPIDFDKRDFIYFHAKWRNEWLPADPPFVDWPLLRCVGGPGRFVGVMLGVVNTEQGWWGEGDEKVWVDNDTFPSYFGTGSEDYFGYAWCNPALFTHAYHAQSIVTGPGNFGYTAVVRFHILDDIPFQKKFRIYIEKWAGADREYCSTSYWYAPLECRDFYRHIPEGFRRVRSLPEPYHVEGALEGEKMQVLRVTGGTTQIQGLAGEFSYGEHLWWLDPEEGSVLELALPVAKDGRCRLTLGLTKSWDYGIHQVLLDGEEMGEPVDLCASQITPLKVYLGEVELAKGQHALQIKCVGTSPDAKPVRHMFGLDYVLLEEAK